METRWFGYQGYTGLLVEGEDFIPGGGPFGATGTQGTQGTQGCQGPYVNGVYGAGTGFGGQGGCCPCKCCPPPCCSSVCTDWVCGSGTQGAQGCTDVIVTETSDPMDPTFIVKEDGFTFVAEEASTSVMAFTVCIVPGTQGSHGSQGSQGSQGAQGSGVCCIEYLGGSFRAVGNGYVDVNYSAIVPDGTCGAFVVKINGSDPPIYVTDGTSLSVSVVSMDPVCCPCGQTGTSNPCGLSMRMAAMMRNDKIVLDRKAVVQKVAAVRKQRLQQKMRMLRS